MRKCGALGEVALPMEIQRFMERRQCECMEVWEPVPSAGRGQATRSELLLNIERSQVT
jgi:hypothetical protein